MDRGEVTPLAVPVAGGQHTVGEPVINILVAIDVDGAEALVAKEHLVAFFPLVVIAHFAPDVIIVHVAASQDLTERILLPV